MQSNTFKSHLIRFREILTGFFDPNRIHGVITRYPCSRFFLMKKHPCFSCSTVLERRKREVVVNSESEEARKYDFEVADFIARGNIKFVTFYFECPNCNAVYKISKLKELEKNRRKKPASKR